MMPAKQSAPGLMERLPAVRGSLQADAPLAKYSWFKTGGAADALFHNTSQLRRVELLRPSTAIGRNTVHAMQSGLVLGYSEMVRGMVARFDKELGGGSKVIATGGLVGVIENELDLFDAVDPNLTLTGLRLIYKMNNS